MRTIFWAKQRMEYLKPIMRPPQQLSSAFSFQPRIPAFARVHHERAFSSPPPETRFALGFPLTFLFLFFVHGFGR